MASFNKYEIFVEDLGSKQHDLVGTGGTTADLLKAALTNTAPNAATHTVLSDINEISAGNGYSSGGGSTQNVGTRSAGVLNVVGTDFDTTASGGTIGPFRYQVLYNAGNNKLIGWWDYGSSITLQDGEVFRSDFGAQMFDIQ